MGTESTRGHEGGVFVVSLDFELHWGVCDHTSRESFAPRVEGARAAVPLFLDRFAAHGIHATFGTVGFLFARDRAELLAHAASPRPAYACEALSPYEALCAGAADGDERTEPDRFAASLVELIANTPGQAVGSHTYSHCYCLEEGMTPAAFEADLRSARAIALERGISLESLIFPRNQYREDYLRIARRCGFTVVRTNPTDRLYRPMADREIGPLTRALRLIDDYVPLTGHNCHALPAAPADPTLPLRVPASRFLRPRRRWLSGLDELRFRRIARSMTRAAHRGELYQLWWHPHNFAADVDANLAMLERVLSHYDALRREHGMRSLSLEELGREIVGDERRRRSVPMRGDRDVPAAA